MNRLFSAPIVAVAALALTGCPDESLAPVDSTLHGTLSLELRDSATVEIVVPSDGSPTTVTLSLDRGFGVAPAGSPLSASGTVEAFPEASLTLYTAKLSAPAEPSGPCGAEPISLALTLSRQGKNAMVVGGLSAYCGADRWHGNPRRVLRLSGELPL
ncbi:MAG: hypothetical protein JRI23_01435 [Deltaproteobacteria bacterium]|jgi:hypothetical protein|nr:hypothetical protein [Deltaproteobacteria bacterium]MBW2530124.1 hypothetical protein [Deltaproteobacteria bacterium]